MSVGQFRSVLAALGQDLTPRELAEILWLATQLPAADAPPVDTHTADTPQEQEETAGDAGTPLPLEERGPDVAGVPVHAAATAVSPVDAYRLPARPVRLAADSSLPRRLELLRALRPLKRRVPSRHARELDEEATIERIAQRAAAHRGGTHLPVLRPAAERWLDAVLVVDGHPASLLLWSSLAREVHRLLIQLGAFRDVRIRYLHAGPDSPPGLSAHPVPEPDRMRDISEICDPSGRRLVLVLTDGVAPGWHDPSAREAVRRWAAAGPLAVLQALPEHLWHRTALPVVPARLRRAVPSAANTEMAYTGLRRRTRDLPAGSVPVPVLELNAGWLGPWAELVAGSGHRDTEAAVTLVDARRTPLSVPADSRSPARRLKDFHAMATPDAFRLAACLSAVPLTVSIMRVVQASMLPGSPPSVLAEVLFSGLIAPCGTAAPTELSDLPHDFLPGVRAALIETLRAHEVDRILLEVSRFLERSADGPAGRVSGMLPDPSGTAGLPADDIPWARLREEALIRAGLTTPASSTLPGGTDYAESSPYTRQMYLTAADFSDVFIGVDAEGRQAVVKVLPQGRRPSPEVFRALLYTEAESLRRMAGQDAPPLLGIDPNATPPWLAMGCITSVSGAPARNLNHVAWWSNGPADNFHSLSDLARKLGGALERAHSLGIVHGNLSPHAVVLVPDRPVLISWVYAQHDGRPHPYPQYRELATGYFPPEGYAQDAPLDPSFDVYGLGAILLHEATRDRYGEWPGRRPESWQVPPRLGDLGALIARCLATDPAERPTARAFVLEVDSLRAGTPWPATSAGMSTSTSTSRSRSASTEHRPWRALYRRCTMLVASPYALHSPEARHTLRDLLTRVIAVEGPVHEDLLVQRAGEAWGLARTGNRVRDNVREVVRGLARVGEVTVEGEFFDVAGRDVLMARAPEGDDTPRKAAHIASVERQVALYRLAAEHPGMSRDELIRYVGEFFGWRRTGWTIRGLLDSDLAELYDRGRLRLTEGRITAVR
ncbi:DUF3320 domain-containing protein [Streptomyces sp. NPDC048275]|uniref:DUF3320 domain-containing protein n=1 Tax=Streptomyces sp. NPDC048275 TaxID=3155629 RepID=UPI0033E265A4